MRKKSLLLSAAVCFAACIVAGCFGSREKVAGPYEIEVKPVADGTYNSDVLENVLEQIRDLPASNKVRGVKVLLPPGIYRFDRTLEFKKDNSSLNSAPVIWCAKDSLNRPVFTTSQVIPPSALRPVAGAKSEGVFNPEVRPYIYEIDLSNLKFKWPKSKRLPKNELRAPLNVPELFCNGKRMKLSVWPNSGWCEIKTITDSGTRKGTGYVMNALGLDKKKKEPERPGSFLYEEAAPSRWANLSNVYLHGFWCYDWRDTIIPVAKIDTDKKEIKLACPHWYSVRKGNPSPRRWKALNIVGEVDSSEEYAVDMFEKKLYFYPPKGIDVKCMKLSVAGLDQPLIRMTDSKNITFENIDFLDTYAGGVEIDRCRGINLKNCLFKNLRGVALDIDHSTGCIVSGCDFSNLGQQGVILSGGNRKTLEPSGNIIENCRIHDFSQLRCTSAVGLQLTGIGNIARNNEIYNSVHIAIMIYGNDHLFEYNVVSNVCMMSDDASALYKGRDPSSLGTVIRHNFFSGIGSPRGHGNAAIYFDDGDSGAVVDGCVFYKCGEPGLGSFGTVFSHGGYSNIVKNCIFVECKRPLGSAPWKQDRWKTFLKSPFIQTRIAKEVDIQSQIYTNRYPLMRGFLDPHAENLRWNAAFDTVFVNCPLQLPPGRKGKKNPAIVCGKWATNSTDVIMSGDPGFVDYKRANFALRADSEIFKKIPGFKNIPFDKIGVTTKKGRPEDVRNRGH